MIQAGAGSFTIAIEQDPADAVDALLSDSGGADVVRDESDQSDW
jgi:hypothetical protein